MLCGILFRMAQSTQELWSTEEFSTDHSPFSAESLTEGKENTSCICYKFAISVIIMGGLCLFGMIGNLICLVALRVIHLKTRSSSTLLLMSLSVCDFLVLAAFLILKVSISLCSFHSLCPSYYSPYFWIAMYGWPTLTLLHCLATWLTVLVTIHRYIAVCHPLKAKTWGSLHATKVHILFVSLSTIGFNIPGYLDYEVIITATDFGTFAPARVLTKLGADHWYQLMYKTISYFIVIYILPVTILLILGGILVKSLTRAEDFRNLSSHQPREATSGKSCSVKDDMTRIMIFIVAIHLLTQPWEPMRRMMSERFSMPNSCGYFLFYFEDLPSLMAVLNSTTNFVVYCFIGKRFRHVCKKLFTSKLSYSNSKSAESTYQSDQF